MAAREVPRVRRRDLGDVPAARAGHGVAVCGGVSGVWHHAGDGEMAVFYVLDPDSCGNRFAGAAVAGLGELAGLCGGARGFWVWAARPRACGGFFVCISANADATIRRGRFWCRLW